MNLTQQIAEKQKQLSNHTDTEDFVGKLMLMRELIHLQSQYIGQLEKNKAEKYFY